MTNFDKRILYNALGKSNTRLMINKSPVDHDRRLHTDQDATFTSNSFNKEQELTQDNFLDLMNIKRSPHLSSEVS